MTLDRCLSRLRLSKEELIDRCSEAVNRVTGDSRRLSEKTFFNDIRAMREGIVLGREANVICDDGRYSYAERGFTLFGTGKEEVLALCERLESFTIRAKLAWERIDRSGLDPAAKSDLKDLLLGDDVIAWMATRDREEHLASEKRRLEMLEWLKESQNKPMEQRRGAFFDRVLHHAEEDLQASASETELDRYRFMIGVIPSEQEVARARRFGFIHKMKTRLLARRIHSAINGLGI